MGEVSVSHVNIVFVTYTYPTYKHIPSKYVLIYYSFTTTFLDEVKVLSLVTDKNEL